MKREEGREKREERREKREERRKKREERREKREKREDRREKREEREERREKRSNVRIGAGLLLGHRGKQLFLVYLRRPRLGDAAPEMSRSGQDCRWKY